MGKNFNSSTKPPFAAENVIYFTDESDLPAPVGGVITPAPNSVWVMYNDDPNASQKQVTLSSEIAIPDAGGFRITSVGLATALLIYTGSGTFLNTTENYTGFTHIDEVFLAAPSGTLFGLDGVLPVGQEYFPRLFMSQMGVFDTAVLGTIKTISVNFNIGACFDCGQGLILDGIEEGLIGDWRWANWKNEVGAVMLTFKNQLRFPQISGCTLETGINETVFDVQPSIGVEPLIITNNSYRGGGAQYGTGTNGAFTAIANDDLSGSIISVAGTPFGESIFTTSVPHGLSEGEVIDHTTFSESQYNGIDIEVLEIVSTTEYRAHLLFTTTDTGAFDSFRIDVTATAHGLVFGDGVQLDTGNFSEGYNSGYEVLTSTANNFSVNQTFGATATGTWSTDSLTQLDPRMSVSSNSGMVSSSEGVFATLNGNVNPTAITSNTYVPLDLTGLLAINLARFEATDLSVGLFTFIGLEDYFGAILANFTIFKSGSTETYRMAVSIDGAVPVFISAFNYATEVTTIAKQFFGSFPIGSISTGQTLQIMIAGEGTGNAATISGGSVIIT